MLTEMTVLILTLLYEAAICSETEIQKVARVITVRAAERHMTIRQVCLEKGQFSCWNGRHRKRVILRTYKKGLPNNPSCKTAWSVCSRVAKDALGGKLNHLPKWNHYYNPDISSPVWKKDLTNKTRDQYHIFGRIE
jgi:pterin-4a-carbinolamine dehydratase